MFVYHKSGSGSDSDDLQISKYFEMNPSDYAEIT